MSSKVGVFVCQLESEGGKYELQVAPVLEVSRTKEGRSEESISKHTFGDCLSDRRLPRPGEPIEPEDRGLVEIFSPRLDLVQDSLPCAPETASATSMLICSTTGTATTIQHREVHCMARG